MTDDGSPSAERRRLRAANESEGGGRRPWQHLTLWAGLLAAASSPTLLFAQQAVEQLGARLYAGQQTVAGYIVGHETPLPATASRCINCHVLARAPSPTTGSQKTVAFGPPLSPEGLKGLVPRRGGPPSRYDMRAFCELLRTGVDPAKVIIQRTMPRYKIDEPQCEALWMYITQPRP